MESIASKLSIDELDIVIRNLRLSGNDSFKTGNVELERPDFFRVLVDGKFVGQVKRDQETIKTLERALENKRSAALTEYGSANDISTEAFIAVQITSADTLFELVWVDTDGIIVRDNENVTYKVNPDSIKADEHIDASNVIPHSLVGGRTVQEFVEINNITSSHSLVIHKGIPYFKTRIDGVAFFEVVKGYDDKARARMTGL